MQPDVTHINHDHSSRGVLVPDCPGCSIVRRVMEEAGLARWATGAAQVVPLSRQTLLRHIAHATPMGHDTHGLLSLSVAQLDTVHQALHASTAFHRAHYADQPRELHTHTRKILTGQAAAELGADTTFRPVTSNPDEHKAARRRQLAERRTRELDAHIDALKGIQHRNGLKAVEMERIVKDAETVYNLPGLEVSIAIAKPHTYAIVQITQAGKVKPYLGIGKATCQPEDAWSNHIGTTLAVGRGLRSIGQQMSLAGRHIDSIRSIR